MQETQDDDPEVRTEVKVHVTALHEGIKEKLESLISDWTRMNKVVAWTQCTRKILSQGQCIKHQTVQLKHYHQ